MQSLWRTIKRSVRDETGAAVVEVSFLIPFILYLTAASMILGIYMIDLAAAKGKAISMSVRNEEMTENDFGKLQEQLQLASVQDHSIRREADKAYVELSISARQLWGGLSQFMPLSYEAHANAYFFLDHRKELMWLKEQEDYVGQN